MRLFNFNGGVKPGPHKKNAAGLPIAVLPAPSFLVIPLHQSIGGTPRPLVNAGDFVLKGQRIGAGDFSTAGEMSSAVHASTSGQVVAVEERCMPHPSGLSALCVIIKPDGRDQWIARQPFDYRHHSPSDTRAYLRDAGIVGLGGAVFPTHLKISSGKHSALDTLIINGAECEPFITCDDRLMRERADAVLRGIGILRELLNAKQVLIGIEDNKPEALAAMTAAVQSSNQNGMAVVAVPTRYPAGGAKQLIRVLTGIEVPHGKRATDYGVQCFNVGTAYAVYEAVALGQPLISRIVTVAGNVAAPRNYEVLIGTPMKDVMAHSQPLDDTDRLIMGGPMMGVTMPGNEVPVVKATNCILVGSPKLFPPPPPEMPCIRCGECAKACPANLQPFELYWFSRAKIFGKAQEYHLFDCIECGCCAYVCPSNIPLVDYYRFAKSEIWAHEREKESADEARERYEFRQLREAREQQEKAARLAAKTAASRAAALAHVAESHPATNANQSAAEVSESASAATAPDQAAAPTPAELIAAALARARVQATEAKNTTAPTAAQQAEIDAIEARRAEIRAQAQPHLPPDD